MRRLVITLMLIAGMLVPTWATGVSANPGSVIDFEGLAEGAIVGSVSSGAGISGDPLTGSATVFGFNPTFGAGTNAAMIFDANCTGAGCSGGDDDLSFPAQGNILIVSEDLDSTDPDDTDRRPRFDVDFSGLGGGVFDIASLTVIDVEGVETGGIIEVFLGGPSGALVASAAVPITGDNGLAVVALGATGDFLRVALFGSGAIDNIQIESLGGGEGCTPGYWKNHLEAWGPTGYSPSDDFDATFGVNYFNPDITLEAAANLGGGGVNRLARHGVAALLSAAHPGVDYPYSVAQVIAYVQAGNADVLEAANELGCPLN